VAFAGALVIALAGRAEPRNYTLHSLAAGQTFGFPVINNEGVVAFLGVVTNPDTLGIEGVVFKNDGTGNVVFFNFSTGGLNFPLGSIDLNDSGAVGIQGASVAPRGILGRIEPDGSFTPLAEADPYGSAPFLEFSDFPSINNSGQLAALVRNTDTTSSILRFDNSGITEIARTTATFFENFSSPTVNDFGVVAFKAQEPDIFVSPFTGSGGSLTNEAPGWGASSARPPIINNSGVLLVDGGDGEPLLFTAKGGVITPAVNGDEAPIFQTLGNRISMNNSCNVAFVSQESTFQPRFPSSLGEKGLFTGNDPIADKVVKTGEIVSGEEVIDIFLSPHAINDRGQITFLIQTANPNIGPWFHVVRADPVEPLTRFCDTGPDAGACPLTQGFWKTHPEEWPVTSLTLGSQTYTQAELLSIFNTPTTGDASLVLTHQLIAAKLNVANGSDSAPISSTLADADTLLSGFTGKLPYKVKTSSATGQAMVNDANVLDNYNNGLLTPGCIP
jgi:hypothetical protein